MGYLLVHTDQTPNKKAMEKNKFPEYAIFYYISAFYFNFCIQKLSVTLN